MADSSIELVLLGPLSSTCSANADDRLLDNVDRIDTQRLEIDIEYTGEQHDFLFMI